MSQCYPSEQEVTDVAEELKTYTADAMKIDMAPLAKAYTEVDMDKLYTELALENIENEPSAKQRDTVKDYKQLFEEEFCESDRQDKSKDVQNETSMTRKRKKGKKVLFKGNPGMGKTTLMKKIGWDWAKGIFTTFSIVFFIFSKLVEPGEAIENIIIRHTPALEGMSITKQKLRQILDQFSEQCLLILDGLDEHALGQNEDVLKIIRGQKLLYCNIIVTSRPHSTKDIERYFNTIVNVEGFNRNHAEKFAAKILTDRRKVHSVLRFSPSGWEYLYVCPIIFLIICVLVKEDQIILGGRNFSNGELYFRLVRFLYVKYTTQKGIEYDKEHLEELLKKMGKLAWDTLRSGNGLLRRSQVIREIGEEAFEYGLLIGNEDFRLVSDEAADILVTFPHRTLQEFLGSYYFVLKLSEGCPLESLLGADFGTARFMQDQLFLDFCSWFANGSEYLIPNFNGKVVLQSLKSYILDRIDVVQFEPEVIARVFPACNIKHAYEYKTHGSALLIFFKEVLSSFCQVQHLMLTNSDPVEYILNSMRENICHLSSIMVEDMNGPSMSMWPLEYESSKSKLGPLTYLQFVDSMQCDGVLDIILTGKMCTDEMLDKMLQRYSDVDKLVSVYLFISDNWVFELSQFLHRRVKKLFMIGYRCCSVTCQKDIPDLTHLYFVTDTSNVQTGFNWNRFQCFIQIVQSVGSNKTA